MTHESSPSFVLRVEQERRAIAEHEGATLHYTWPKLDTGMQRELAGVLGPVRVLQGLYLEWKDVVMLARDMLTTQPATVPATLAAAAPPAVPPHAVTPPPAIAPTPTPTLAPPPTPVVGGATLAPVAAALPATDQLAATPPATDLLATHVTTPVDPTPGLLAAD
jgi:hypothetical protein